MVDQFNRNLIGPDWTSHVSMPTGCLPAVSFGARFDQNGTPNSRCWLTTSPGFDLTGDHVMAYIPAITNRPAGWTGFLRVVSDNINDAFQLFGAHGVAQSTRNLIQPRTAETKGLT